MANMTISPIHRTGLRPQRSSRMPIRGRKNSNPVAITPTTKPTHNGGSDREETVVEVEELMSAFDDLVGLELTKTECRNRHHQGFQFWSMDTLTQHT